MKTWVLLTGQYRTPLGTTTTSWNGHIHRLTDPKEIFDAAVAEFRRGLVLRDDVSLAIIEYVPVVSP